MHLNLSKYKYNNVIKWDIVSYYSYLPAAFIDKDLSLNFVTPENNQKADGIKYWYIETENGGRLIKYSMGMAIMYAPFFFVAHSVAPLLGYANDGFSGIYEFFIDFSGLFYFLVGLWYLRKVLLCFFSEQITVLTLLLVFFGTNLLYYTSVESAMPHAYSFALISVFTYFVITFYKSEHTKHLIVLAICYGLIVLIRPINIFIVLLFLLYNVLTLGDLKNRLRFFMKHYQKFAVFLLITALIVFPQLLYYKYITGHWLVFSYGNESFFFSKPQIINVLFSFKKGWFIYTPIMFVAILGIWKLKNCTTQVFISGILVLVPLYIYLISSWWCWWYGGSFSQRALIDIYPLLSIPLATLLHHWQQLSSLKYRIGLVTLGLLLLLNIFQTFQYKYNIIDYDGMTAKEYFQVFGSLNPKDIKPEYLEKPNYENALVGKTD